MINYVCHMQKCFELIIYLNAITKCDDKLQLSLLNNYQNSNRISIMYKYLPIAENLNEMMVMLKSLPAYTLVFDLKCNLVDMNQPAMQLFRVNNVQEFNANRDDIFPTPDYIRMIICELKKGTVIRNAKTLLKFGYNSYSVIELCACMINGSKDLFLFQLFEISLSTTSDLGSFTSYNGNDSIQSFNVKLMDNSVTNAKDVFVLQKSTKTHERLNKRHLEDNPMLLERFKSRELTRLESTVSRLLTLNFSVDQISNLINIKSKSVQSIILRISEKKNF